ncbi:AraC family transcriptional regulator [Actinosynnema sp. ALI-1.44]|uniref:helix-turn-helix transcriptional regulator n=1 Tax=Actinosynnema sp. ALI-1.44 TaxID=1933779 RepID=UPI00097BA935|nr:AraC family transcriptional regulator [Actinosynnema sp. ALI-1.44]ONI75008.1 AraC family transcriptional regulator [Actinosynnema sp. ALI-1.44]
MEQATWTRVDAGQGAPLDLMTARFVRHVFAPHAHDEFAIGACTDGMEIIRVGTRSYRGGPGDIVVIEPGETHTGGAGVPEGFAYRAIYPQWTSLADAGVPHFPVPVVHDPELAAEFHRTHEMITRWRDPLEAESRLSWTLAALVHRHAVGARRFAPVRAGEQVTRVTKERLADRLVDPPGLHEIADELGLSRFQVVRVFRDTVGMPPFAWLSQYRATRARALLASGHRPAQAAALTGFADQAHLTRWFRRVFGVTPGAFRNSVQDSAPRPR